MSDERVTVDMVAMFRQNTDALLRSAACIGFAAEFLRNRGHLDECERLEDVIVAMASLYGMVTSEDPEQFVRLLGATYEVVTGAATVSPVIVRDKLNA